VRLLIGDANQIGQLLLCKAQHGAPLADAAPDMPINLLCTVGKPAFVHDASPGLMTFFVSEPAFLSPGQVQLAI
jgi:hypothetical protein